MLVSTPLLGLGFVAKVVVEEMVGSKSGDSARASVHGGHLLDHLTFTGCCLDLQLLDLLTSTANDAPPQIATAGVVGIVSRVMQGCNVLGHQKAAEM